MATTRPATAAPLVPLFWWILTGAANEVVEVVSSLVDVSRLVSLVDVSAEDVLVVAFAVVVTFLAVVVVGLAVVVVGLAVVVVAAPAVKTIDPCMLG